MRETSARSLTKVETCWGDVYVDKLRVSDVESLSSDTDDKNSIAKSIARITLDAEGNKIFDINNKDDIALISKQTWSDLKKIVDASNTVNALNVEGVEKVKKP